MKQFKYSLQAVHDVREIQRDHAEIQVGRVVSELTQTVLLLESVIETRKRAAEEVRKLHNSPTIEPAIAATHSEYLNSLILRERELRKRVSEVEQRVATERQNLTERCRDAKVTAKICDRQRTRHQLETARWEQKSLDEIAVAAVARREGRAK